MYLLFSTYFLAQICRPRKLDENALAAELAGRTYSIDVRHPDSTTSLGFNIWKSVDLYQRC